jgi:acyl-CoA thioester hydrolase
MILENSLTHVVALTPVEAEFRLLHSTIIPIRWGDLDAMQHVNNTIYFRFMEQARFESLSTLEYELGEDGSGPVVINSHCTFKRPLKFPGNVRIATYIGAVGRSSVETFYRMYSVEHDDALVAEAGAKVVWMDLTTEKSVPIPDAVRARFAELFA